MSATAILRRTALSAALVFACGTTAAQQHSTIWWNPAESGWGLYVVDQGNVLGAYWFTHDVDGEPVWFLAVTTPQADGSYRGDIARVTGVPLAQIAGNASDPQTVIGTTQLGFGADNALSFRYTVSGQTQTKALQRFDFDGKDVVCRATTAPRTTATNYSDIWWNPASSGWGLHISHVDERLIATWYTYDTDREPIFYQGVTTRQADGSYRGELYRSNNGTPFLQINGAPASSGTTQVGTLALRFSDGQKGQFDYTINGTTQSKAIERLQFGSAAGVCSVEPYGATDDGDDDGGTQGDDCLPPYSVGDVREVRFDKGQPGEGTRTERITGTANFQGQQALVEEVSGATSAGTGVYAKNYVQNGDGTRISFGAEAFDPSSGALISRTVNQPLRIEQPRAFSVGQSFELRWVGNSTAQGVNTSEQLRSKSTLLGREQVTVPAGTFTACKFAVETDLDSSVSVQGFTTTVRVRRTGTSWTSPQFGLLKLEDSGTSVVSTPFGDTSTTVNGALELLSATVGGRSTP